MNLNTEKWQEFKVSDIFQCSTTKMSIKDDLTEGNIPFISRTAENNGCDCYVDVEPEKITKGDCITVGAEGIYAFYQPKEFATGNKIYTLRNPKLNEKNALFICAVLNNDVYKYSYGRARIKSKLENEIIKLPEKNGEPDWRFMEDYMMSLNHRDLNTQNRGGYTSLTLGDWKEYRLKDICNITYGVNLEVVNCEETTKNDINAIPFVSRTENDNGISAYVVKTDIKPNPADTISIAGGGSVLSTFYQPKEYYSGRDLFYLETKEKTSKYAKLFLCSVITKNKYKYSYGRQANKTMKDIVLLLPTKNNKPDWQYMENYIKNLPYGDEI